MGVSAAPVVGETGTSPLSIWVESRDVTGLGLGVAAGSEVGVGTNVGSVVGVGDATAVSGIGKLVAVGVGEAVTAGVDTGAGSTILYFSSTGLELAGSRNSPNGLLASTNSEVA